MKVVVLTFVFLLSIYSALAQEHHSSVAGKPAILMPGLGQHHHTIWTASSEAQRFFDQGLIFVYAFNHDEAGRSFRRAAELDPRAPMPLWGIALAVGPNYNLDVDPEREREAYEAIQKALALAPGAPENERAYVEALAKRYSIDPKADLKKLAVDYKEAMGELAKRYPDDLDAATLYAESMMDLRPWRLWTSDGRPAEGTEEIISVLESVLKRDPQHVGANHFYIHAVEASPHPERALPSAGRLGSLAPAAGHLVHMPAHIYMRTGDYEAAAKSNGVAAQVDRAYIESNGVEGIYPMMYYGHNLHFLAAACGMEGRFADAKEAADRLPALVGPHLKDMPTVEFYMPTPMFILLRFQRWDEILKMSSPETGTNLTYALWRFARGVAFAAKGELQNAENEEQSFAAAEKEVPEGTPFGNNRAGSILNLAREVLKARIAATRGDRKATLDHWKKAVEMQDALLYDEPPAWYYPVRESLGGAWLRSGRYEEAEKVFRADLEANPRNGRSLFGLWESLKAQKKMADAEWVKRDFEAAWKNADTELRLEDL